MNQDIILLIISLIGFGLIAYLLYYLSGKVKDTSSVEDRINHDVHRDVGNRRAQQNNQGGGGGGLRHRRNEENVGNDGNDGNDDNDDNDDGEMTDHTTKRDILKHEKVIIYLFLINYKKILLKK